MIGFGARLKAARRLCSLTTVTASNAIGRTNATWSLWENDKRQPKLEELIEICKLLHTTPNHLLGISENNESSITATGNAIVATGGSRVVAKKTTQVTPDCAKCPYKIAIENLKKSGFSFKGL